MEPPADSDAAQTGRTTTAPTQAPTDAVDTEALFLDQVYAISVLGPVWVPSDRRADLEEFAAGLNVQATEVALAGAPVVNMFHVIPVRRYASEPTSHDDDPPSEIVGWKIQVAPERRARIEHVVEAAPRVRARLEARREAQRRVRRSTVHPPAPHRGARARGAGRPAVRRHRVARGDGGDSDPHSPDDSDSDRPALGGHFVVLRVRGPPRRPWSCPRP